jgi:hypothetical protein
MKFSLVAIAALAGIVAAAPTDLEKRQITANDLAGACKKITLIYARVSLRSSQLLRLQLLTVNRPVPK